MGLRDPISSLSHLAAAVAALFATCLLVRLTRHSPERRIAAAVFGGSMVLLFGASGLFHGLPITLRETPEAFTAFRRVDQSAIFLMIAGTNTPIMVALLSAGWRLAALAGMWSLAAAAVTGLWALPTPPHEAIVVFCLGMGFVGMVPLAVYYRAVGWRAMNWVWAGALLYTAGALVELLEWPSAGSREWRFGFHEVFHLFVAVASIAFFVFVARHALPYRRSPVEPEA